MLAKLKRDPNTGVVVTQIASMLTAVLEPAPAIRFIEKCRAAPCGVTRGF
jgi:hypothetical protein